MIDKIKLLLMDNLESVYCDTCDNKYCEDCDRKSMNWGISEGFAESLGCKINELYESDNVKLIELVKWLQGEKYGYHLEDHKTWINYGDLNDKFPYDENEKKWELSRNRMIDKTIQKIIEINQ